MPKFIFLALLFPFCLSALGQECLTVEHGRKNKLISYCPGDEIRIIGRYQGKRHSGIIERIEDSTLILLRPIKMPFKDGHNQEYYRDYVPLSDIEAVYVNKESFLRKARHFYSGTAMVGGGFIIGTTSVNTFIDGKPPSYRKIVLATGILVTGFIVRYLGREKYKIGKKWVLNSSEPANDLEDEYILNPNL